jgi:ABC-type antimicrobial peptide transport system permease subunit
LALCGAGISIGTLITLGAARLLSAILYGVSPRDPATYITAVLLLTAVGVLACWNPAAKAMQIDPARVLREE